MSPYAVHYKLKTSLPQATNLRHYERRKVVIVIQKTPSLRTENIVAASLKLQNIVIARSASDEAIHSLKHFSQIQI